jgi:hypothetical protein
MRRGRHLRERVPRGDAERRRRGGRHAHRDESRALRGELEALRKPLLAVLVTQPHPDHVAGITNLVAHDPAKIVATQAVLELMKELDEPKRRQWTPVYGAEWVQRWTYPNTIATSGVGRTARARRRDVLGPRHGGGGDAEANSVWFVDRRRGQRSSATWSSTEPTPTWLTGTSLAWLANLTRIESLCRDLELVFRARAAEAGWPARLRPARLPAHARSAREGALRWTTERLGRCEGGDRAPDAGALSGVWARVPRRDERRPGPARVAGHGVALMARS